MEDYVLLAHGNGGSLTYQLIEECFFPYLGDPLLRQLDDQAIVELGDSRLAFTTDSFVVDPLFFPGGDIGTLAVYGTVNDLAVGGAIPLYLSIGFIIEEGFPVRELKKIASSIKASIEVAGVRLVTADTKVVEKGACDKLFINTSGIGIVRKGANVSASNVRVGDKVILSGHIGDHGMAILSSRQGISFETSLISDCAPLNLLVDAISPCLHQIHAMRDLTRGGLATVLNEIALQAKVGIVFNEASVPVKEEVRGMCDMLGLDPLYLANEGKLVAFVHPDAEKEILSLMKRSSLGKEACTIGEVIDDPLFTVSMETQVGGVRLIQMLVGEDLPRIC